MLIQYKDFEQRIEKEYGDSYLQKYQIYSELRKKITQNNLTDEETELLCDSIYRIIVELLNKSKINTIEIIGFCDIVREQYKHTSYKEVVNKLTTPDGYERVKAELNRNINEYEMVYLAAKNKYGGDFIEKMEPYREMRRMTMKANFNSEETNDLLNSVAAASKTLDICVSTSAEFAHILKIMHIPVNEIQERLTTISGRKDIVYRYELQRNSIVKAQKALNRIRYVISLKFSSFPEFYRVTGIGHHPIRTLMYGGLPNISSLIKIAYATNTTLEYLINGKNDKVINRIPIDELLENDRYNAKIFIERITEFCKTNNMNIRTMLIDCGVNPFTLSAWNTEKREPTTEIICRICDGKQLNIDYMLGLTNKKDETYFVSSI